MYIMYLKKKTYNVISNVHYNNNNNTKYKWNSFPKPKSKRIKIYINFDNWNNMSLLF